jgi:hypothetical protein
LTAKVSAKRSLLALFFTAKGGSTAAIGPGGPLIPVTVPSLSPYGTVQTLTAVTVRHCDSRHREVPRSFLGVCETAVYLDSDPECFRVTVKSPLPGSLRPNSRNRRFKFNSRNRRFKFNSRNRRFKFNSRNRRFKFNSRNRGFKFNSCNRGFKFNSRNMRFKFNSRNRGFKFNSCDRGVL